ncbi:MAG TPA: PLP-dependent aminotransferase family protein [Actinomycetota bacterium]|jgi:DNA-binding transcriptional MocR family regulator|nr:PLP-dependent aminotransferase family protein [Actinomycetota bacterium]
MAEFNVDPYADLYARRASGMTASEVRALFSVASRPDVVSLAGGMPYVQGLPTEHVLEVVESVLVERADVALQYGGGQGSPVLRERLARLMAEEDTPADPEDLVVTTGAQQALDLVGKVLLDPGDVVAVEAPAYVGALSAFSVYEPRFLQVDLDDDGMIVEQLEEALLRGERPKFVYTVPNFHNPAGVTMSRARREQLVALCREARIPIIEDNPYGMLRFDGEPLPTLRSLDRQNVIYLGTVSKVFAPGVRVGWAVAEPGVLQRLVLAKEAADLCGSQFTMLVTERYFDGELWRRNLGGLVATYRSRRDAMLTALKEHFPSDARWTMPSGGFFVWVTLPDYFDTPALLAAAVDRKVAYVPGTGFYPDGRGRQQMRLCFSYPTEERIAEGIRRLGELLADEEELFRSLSGA